MKGAIAAALAIDGPAIIDAVVNPDELPNLPHLEINVLRKYAIAKVKEAVLAVRGG